MSPSGRPGGELHSVSHEGAPAPLLRLGVIGAALMGYAFVSHLLMVHAADRPWTVAALFGPLWAAVAVSGWQRRHGPTLALCAAVVAAVVVVVARGGVDDIHLMYVLQHAGIHAALAWVFGSTLRSGSRPLITAMAQPLHRDFTPRLATYTRQLTALWAAYFVAMIAVSFTLYALAPWSWWSLFCNLVTPLAAVVLFVGEYLYRWRWHPEFERVSLPQMVQAYRQRGAKGAAQ